MTRLVGEHSGSHGVHAFRDVLRVVPYWTAYRKHGLLDLSGSRHPIMKAHCLCALNHVNRHVLAAAFKTPCGSDGLILAAALSGAQRADRTEGLLLGRMRNAVRLKHGLAKTDQRVELAIGQVCMSYLLARPEQCIRGIDGKSSFVRIDLPANVIDRKDLENWMGPEETDDPAVFCHINMSVSVGDDHSCGDRSLHESLAACNVGFGQNAVSIKPIPAIPGLENGVTDEDIGVGVVGIRHDMILSLLSRDHVTTCVRMSAPSK